MRALQEYTLTARNALAFGPNKGNKVEYGAWSKMLTTFALHKSNE